MATRKILVNRLLQDELVYMLTVRGIGTGNVQEMRHRLSLALQMEKRGESIRYPKYPFKFEEDAQAIQEKLTVLTPEVASFKNTRTSGEFLTLQTRLSFVLDRLDNMEVDEDDEQKKSKKAELLALTLSLMEKLNRRLDEHEKSQAVIPPELHLLEGLAEEEDTNGIVNASTSSQIQSTGNAPMHAVKPILPNKWDLKFSGDKKGLSVTAFFERVDELRKARNVSQEILLESGIDLFTGRAYQFYQECRSEVNSWDELVKMFREEYLPSDYNEKLFEEIKRRTQGPEESIGTYLAVMSKYFQRLSCPVSEEARLKIILRNISPFYQNQLGLTDITSIWQLRFLCRRLEARRDAVENYSMPSRRSNALEPDLAYLQVEEKICGLQVSAGPSRAPSTSAEIVCFRCNKPGHRAIGCVVPSKKFCYKCKKEGYTIKTCPSCSQGNANRRT